MRAYKTVGIIIKRRNVGEADRLITVFTKDEGKIQLKGKGVRKISSRRASHIELLNLSELAIYKGGKTGTLTEVQTIQSYPNVKSNLYKIGFAYHICELIDALCPEGQEQQSIYTMLTRTLSNLEESADTEVTKIVENFEFSLLTLLGYWSADTPIPPGQNLRIIESILERKLKSHQLLPDLI